MNNSDIVKDEFGRILIKIDLNVEKVRSESGRNVTSMPMKVCEQQYWSARLP